MEKYAVLTMDVEDWYQSYAFEGEIDRSVTMLDGLEIALEIMNARNIRGSFFVLGEIADRLRGTLRAMDDDGHDIACHGWAHDRPLSMAPEDFRGQLSRAKAKLEDVLGHGIAGYRGPCFAMDDVRLQVVRDVGFCYDSSRLKPQKSSKYGDLALSGFEEIAPCIYRSDRFMEFEVSTQRIADMNMLLGGGYIRMLPWPFMRSMTRRYLDTGKLYVMYIHPLDFSREPTPAPARASVNRYLRMTVGRRRMAWRFQRVIDMLVESGYSFVTFEQLRQMYV